MKKFSYLLIVFVAALVSCKNSDKFVISGAFKNATPQSKVYLFGLKKDNALALDSTVFSDKGEFKFEHTTPGVDFFRITTNEHEYMFIAQNGDNIKITADLQDNALAYQISGATEADKLQELNTIKNQYIGRINAIQTQFEETVASQPDKREMIMQQIKPKYEEEVNGMNNAILKFAQGNTESLAAFYAINLLNPSEHEDEVIAYSDKIKSSFNENEAVTEFLKRASGLKALQVGQSAPAFTIDGISGKPIKLSDFKGKYVLLDFWASWCMPCRQENPNLVRAYHQYKGKNFTILGISLDKDIAAWKQAIDADKLEWAHASELQDFQGATVRLYQIEAIPSSFLIDPNGKIIAKNLRGEELDAFLDKTLR